MLILQILKTAGIILVSLAGLLLLLFLLLMILPWRYRIRGTLKGKEYKGELEISWLLKAVWLRQYAESGTEAGGILRIFGLRLFRRGKEFPDGSTGSREEQEQHSQPERTAGQSPEPDTDSEAALQTETKPMIPEDPVQIELIKNGAEQPGSPETEAPAAREAGSGNSENGPERKPEYLIRPLEEKLEDLIRKAADNVSLEAEKLSKFGKTVAVKLFNNSRSSLDKLKQLKELFCGETNRQEIFLLLRTVRKVMRQILPREGSGTVVFGLGDPYYTGKILEILAFLYPLYGEAVQVCPWFEEEKLEAEGDVRGHVHLIVLLFLFARVCLNRRLRGIYTEFMRIISNEKQSE